MTPALPRAARPFVTFPSVLRAHGFAVAPEQTTGFIEAVGLLGPRAMDDIYRASRAMLGPQPERLPEFDALFRAFFLGQTLEGAAFNDDEDDDLRVRDDGDGLIDTPETEEESESGGRAATAEVLNVRRFLAADEASVLRRFRRAAAARLPKRSSYRRLVSKRGDAWHLGRALREAVRRDGEVLHLPKLRRKRTQRRILLLIDVSGSMKRETDGYLRFAHSLARVAERIEIFTLGTRLTRVTRALRRRHPDQALAMASGMVADWDGGTRIGDALQGFLAVPRFAGFARGALVVVLSDGLERGTPDAMIDAVRRLARLAWRIEWLSPAGPNADNVDFRPKTAALQAIHPLIDHLGDGSSIERIAGRLLTIARRSTS